jgi:CRP-like cAMP-binding protein
MSEDSPLRYVSLFAGLSDADLRLVTAIAQPRHYRKRQVIFHAEDHGSTIFILKSGAVKISVVDREGREMILKLLYPGDFFGEMALLDGQHRSATVTAVDEVDALVIERDNFLQLLRQHPGLALTLLLTLCQRLREMDEKIKSLVFSDAFGKVAQTLLRLIRERGQKDKDISLALPLSRQELANLVGITRQTLSRVLREYQQAGVLEIKKRRMLILNEARLQKDAG